MGNDTRISCIVPTINRGMVLLDTINMLLHQDYRAHEIIVIDQTSSLSAELMDSIRTLQSERQIFYITQEEPNASKARNRGALAASGDYLLFLDDDIRIGPDFLGNYASVLARTSAEVVAGQVLEGDCKTVDHIHSKAMDPEIGWLYFPKNYSRECETSFLMAGNFAIWRDVYFKVGGMDENYEKGAYREESDFAMRLLASGEKILFAPSCSIIHLGAKVVKGGGARSWRSCNPTWYFHHVVGDWYFILGYGKLCTLPVLFWRSIRFFVLNGPKLKNPVQLLAAAAMWPIGGVVAAIRRIKGPKLICSLQR